MKAIYGNVPVDKTYSMKEVYLSDGQVCDNCSMIIKNVAVIESEGGEFTYEIGLDCADALTSISSMEVLEAKKQLNRKRRFIRSLLAAKSIIIDKQYDSFFFWHKEGITDWNSWYKGRGLYSAFKDTIDKLNAVITYKTL